MRSRSFLPTLKVVVFWLLVLVPLGWGVWKSVEKSMPLFRQATPAGPAGRAPE